MKTLTKQSELQSEVKAMIAGAIARHGGDKKSLRKELCAIQWRLTDKDGRSVNLQGPDYRESWCPYEEGIVFDGRDNEDQKLAWYSMKMKTPLQVQLLPQIVSEAGSGKVLCA